MAYSDEVRTAQQVLAANGGDSAKENARQAALIAEAETEGVTRSEYIGYEEGFANYEARADIEPLVERRAREAGVTAGDAEFRRKGDGSAAVFTSPGDGNVGGLYLDSPGADDTPVARADATAYELGDRVTFGGGTFEATVAGTSGTGDPDVTGLEKYDRVEDGTVEWIKIS